MQKLQEQSLTLFFQNFNGKFYDWMVLWFCRSLALQFPSVLNEDYIDEFLNFR